MQRLRPLNEQECYLRCYGWVRGDDAVRVTNPGSGATEAIESTAIMTERIRIAFERLIDEDEAQAA